MGLIRVFWDTNLFIYLLEENTQFFEAVRSLWKRIILRNDLLLTSTLTLGELLVGPILTDRVRAATARAALHSAATLIPFDEAAAEHFARIRAETRIKPADAIQLACAAAAKADLFVTNDERLSRVLVPGVPILTSLAAVPI